MIVIEIIVAIAMALLALFWWTTVATASGATASAHTSARDNRDETHASATSPTTTSSTPSVRSLANDAASTSITASQDQYSFSSADDEADTAVARNGMANASASSINAQPTASLDTTGRATRMSPSVSPKSTSPSMVSVGGGGGRVGGRRRYVIAMCSDFCYPNMGGVEMHIYQLSQCLLRRGHKVIVITHSYGRRRGVRYMNGGLKLFYIPHRPVYNGNSLPTGGTLLLPLIRHILLRERVDIVHCHQAFSTIAHESLLFARTMGLRTCFTDHSLFGFADASSILMNKVLKFSLSDVNHVICVSNTSKENTCLRAALEPELVSVIPNAVDTTMFTPQPSRRDPDRLTIVIISRLVYRKGVDLLVEVIPQMCARHRNVHFLIGGDGPKRLALEEMRERHQLEDRVEMLGAVDHASVRDVLVRGDLFLNCSLTEAFCIAIVEAVSCGLYCVSTRVGGVPEVLPSHMIALAEPDSADIVRQLERAMSTVQTVDPYRLHRDVQIMYNWHTVAERTERVYTAILQQEHVPLFERLCRFYGCGPVAGKLNCVAVAFIYLYYLFLEYWYPRDEIDVAPDFIMSHSPLHGGAAAVPNATVLADDELSAERAAAPKRANGDGVRVRRALDTSVD